MSETSRSDTSATASFDDKVDPDEPVHDHELEVLEDDENVPPRPEEEIADASR